MSEHPNLDKYIADFMERQPETPHDAKTCLLCRSEENAPLSATGPGPEPEFDDVLEQLAEIPEGSDNIELHASTTDFNTFSI